MFCKTNISKRQRQLKIHGCIQRRTTLVQNLLFINTQTIEFYPSLLQLKSIQFHSSMHYCQISYVMIYSRNEHIYRMSTQCVVARIENVYLQIHICSGLIDCINLKYYKPQHVSISISIKYIRLQFSEYEMEFTYNITGNNNTMLNLANY